MLNKKIALFLPSNIKSVGGVKGILGEKEVKKIRNILSKKLTVYLLDGIEFRNIIIRNNDFSCNRLDLGKVNLFFWYALGMEKYYSVLKALAQVTKVIKSPNSFQIVADKFLSHSLLKKNNLPVAEFALLSFSDLNTMKEIIKKWKVVIIKPRLGNFGRGIVRVDNFETLRDIAGYLKMEHKQNQIFVERFYENDINKWISTTIINGKVAYGYRKKKEKFADWKVYDIKAKGGDAYYVDPSPVKKIAEKAAKILDTSIVGFDFIKTHEGYKIVDENNFPGFYPDAFTAAKKDVSKLIADLIVSHANKLKS